MSGKRKHEEFALPYNAKLTAVTHALDCLSHVDDSDELTSGACTEFPFPGLRLQGNREDLPLPLTASGRDQIVQKSSENDATWSVPSASVEVRNPEWLKFVDKIVDRARKPLGVSSTGVVYAALNSVVLLRSGGRLSIDRNKRTKSIKHAVFGTLAIALPGEFSGGEISIRRDDEKPRLQWQPRATGGNVYNVTYGAFYNSDRVEIEPVSSGEALYLFYDLVTSTIQKVPRFAGAAVLERCLNESLAQFFEPLPAAKRFKVGDDVWRRINEFLVNHRFVYPVTGNNFDVLEGTDQSVAQHLAAFCAQSGGQYILYLTRFHCSRKTYSREDDMDTNILVSLTQPWIRHSERQNLSFPLITVDPVDELAPAGYLEGSVYEVVHEDVDEDDGDEVGLYDGEYHDHYDSEDQGNYYSKIQEHFGHALVVQPATLEHVLWAKMPVMDAVRKIDELVTTAPVEAARLARRVLANKQRWINTDTSFIHFLRLAILLKDAALFCDLLLSVAAFEFEDKVLYRVIHQYQWDTCAPTIERILPKISFRSRVNFACSVLQGSFHTNRTTWLIERLIKAYPWSASQDSIGYGRYCGRGNTDPTIADFSRLLALANKVSMSSVARLLGKPSSSTMTYDLFIPAFTNFASELSVADRLSFKPILRKYHDSLTTALPKLRNASYAACQIPIHCDTCVKLQAFCSSTERQISIRVKNPAHLKHIQTTITRQVSYAGTVAIVQVPPNVILRKESLRTSRSTAAEQCLASLASLLATDLLVTSARTCQGFVREYDEDLTAVTRALDCLIGADDGDELTSDAFTEFPLPGLRLKGDPEDLSLPLTASGADAIVQKTKRQSAKDNVWSVTSQSVCLRNPEWTSFIHKIVDRVCEPFGVSDAAQVDATLNSVVLLRPGGRLPTDQSKRAVARKRGVFGTLVLALPSEFTGGEISIRRDDGKPRRQWKPRRASRNLYIITYGAFFNSDRVEIKPVAKGEALSLVYDLETPTVQEIPRFAGVSVLEEAVTQSLFHFFAPAPPAKHCDIDRRFVYPVSAEKFEDMQGNDRQVFDRLAAFCDESDGLFELYLAELECTRTSYSRQNDDDDAQATFEVSLSAPWIKHGNTTACELSTVTVDECLELAPVGYVETVHYEREDDTDDERENAFYIRGYHEPPNPDDIVKKRRHYGNALVVQMTRRVSTKRKKQRAQ